MNETNETNKISEIIRKRKSVRKYDYTPLDAEALDKIRSKIENVAPLYPDIKYSVEIVNKTTGIFNIKAPHYLIFRSEEKDGALENIGFIGQQLDLFLSGSGLGSCWLGASRPEDQNNSGLNFIISIAFGKPAEPLHRALTEFKRKPLAEISEGADARLEAARLAPSAVNAQNWYFIAENKKICCYRKKANPWLGFIYNKLHCIDMGIALCHIAAESEKSDGFSFAKEATAPEKKGYVYMGTVGGGEPKMTD